MDVRRVRVEEVHLLQAAELHLRVAESVHRDVDGDVDPELLGELPLVADDILLAEVRAARREGHRDQALVVGEVLRAHPPRLVAIDPLGASGVVHPEPPGLDRRVGEAEREDRSDPALLEPAHRFVRVLGRVHDVRPVHERRDPGVQALERAPQVAGVDVLGPVLRRELVEDGAEIGAERVVGSGRPDRRLPRVAVGVDEPGDDDVAIGLDHPRAVGAQAAADLGDPVALDQDVGSGHLAERVVLGEHGCPSDEDSVSHEFDPFLLRASSLGRESGAASYAVTPSSAFVRRCSATIDVSRSGPNCAVAARTIVLVDAGLRHRCAKSVRQLEDEAEVLRGEVEREGDRSPAGVEERRLLVSDVRGSRRSGGEDVVGGFARDAGPFREDERLGDRLVQREDQRVDRELQRRRATPAGRCDGCSSPAARVPDGRARDPPPSHRP